MESNKFNFSVSLRFRVTKVHHYSASKSFKSVNESSPINYLFSSCSLIMKIQKEISNK